MTPFELLELVGLKVGAHVLDTHHAAFPDRFFESENLHKLAEHGKILDRDGKGKVKGYDKTARRDRRRGHDADDRRMSCASGSRTAWPTRSTACSRTVSWPRPKTSTCA